MLKSPRPGEESRIRAERGRWCGTRELVIVGVAVDLW